MENEIQGKKKENLGLIILTIILSILVICLVGYIVIDKSSANKTASGKEQKNAITSEQVEKLISFVPFYKESPLSSNNDAYSGTNYTINSINEDVLLYMAYINTDAVKFSNNSDMPSYTFSWCGTDSCTGDEYYYVSDINKKLVSMYNKSSVSVSDISIPAGGLERYNSYYVAYYGAGAVGYFKNSKIISFDLDKNNNLIVYEKVGFYKQNDTSYIYIFKNTSDMQQESEDLNLITKIETDSKSDADKYIESNWNLFNTFKHTFKLNANGKYYWYSTEVSND
jgi:hypothetical protein